MKLREVIALAKAGYSKKDIEAIILEEASQAEEIPEEELSPEEPEVDEPMEPKEDAPEEFDYKKLYEESQDKLKKAQEVNRQNSIIPISESDEDIVNNFVKEFL